VQRKPFPLVLVASVASLVLLSGCAGLEVHAGSGAGDAPSGAASASQKPAPKLAVANPAPWNSPLTVSVADGSFTSVTVTDKKTTEPLAGAVDPSTGDWVSTTWPSSGAAYRVSAVVAQDDTVKKLAASVTVVTQPDSSKTKFGILPGKTQVVGVNAPIVIRFTHKVTDKVDVENALTVASSTPVVGAWHWINDAELHFRPKDPWPAHTTVEVTAAFAGLQMSDTRWGTRDATSRFTVGDAHQTIVNDRTHTFVFKVNGKVVYTWVTSLGKPEFETRTGNYIVLEKDALREMTSCQAQITCDKNDPQYYDLKVQWDTRLSWSGTFIHGAPWDSHLGLADVSHGCIHLTLANAKTYFDLARYGDIVNVLNTTRTIDDLVAKGDPGASDWNTTWPEWISGSAVGAELTTDPLPTA
jgi:lipoprotein-anchoring transpeptidase ErfK/SrfK